ncbi:MAG: sugar phosphate nucleotidyltransferase [Acidimicrobiia bacterium]|nr:sugar phosphate nucleotidyltransferase [Acidimicrobiia bacterium]
MRALILAGGKGSRLRPFTFTIPKPLVPIGEIPIIEILIRQLRAQGFDQISISVGHLAGLIEAFCGNGDRWGVAIDYVYENEPLGTAGCLGLMDVKEDQLLVVNGDTFTDLHMGEVFAAHDPKDALTICANRRSVAIEFGVLETDASELLTDYREKPTLSYWVSMGVNVVSKWAIDEYVVRGQRLDMPELVEAARTDGKPVRVLKSDAYWLDLGRMADLEAGVAAFEENPQRFLPA